MSMMLVFSASQAEWISGRADAEILLRRLARSNGFITYISQDGTYKLHHLMQESVQQAFARLPEEQQAKYLSRAGMWQLEHGYAASAARLFYKARDFHGLMRAVECGQGADLSAEHKTRCWLGSENAPAPCAMHIRWPCWYMRGACLLSICAPSALPRSMAFYRA